MTYEEEVKRKEAFDKINQQIKRHTPTQMQEDDDDDDDDQNNTIDYTEEFKDDYDTKGRLSQDDEQNQDHYEEPKL